MACFTFLRIFNGKGDVHTEKAEQELEGIFIISIEGAFYAL